MCRTTALLIRMSIEPNASAAASTMRFDFVRTTKIGLAVEAAHAVTLQVLP